MNMTRKIEKGNFVKVCYTGKFDDGQVFDQTESCNPIEVEVGAGEVIKGFEDALVGMAQNEKKTFTLEPDEAYGNRDEGMQQSFTRSDLPPDFKPEIGEVVVLQNREGGQMLATIKQVDMENVTVDLNHPLAGKALTFDIEVAEINDEPSKAPSQCGSGCCCH